MKEPSPSSNRTCGFPFELALLLGSLRRARQKATPFFRPGRTLRCRGRSTLSCRKIKVDNAIVRDRRRVESAGKSRAEPRCRMGIFTTEAGSVEQKVWCCGTLAAGFYFPPNFAFSVSLR